MGRSVTTQRALRLPIMIATLELWSHTVSSIVNVLHASLP